MRPVVLFSLVLLIFQPNNATLEENVCPKQQLSGLDYGRTQATLKAAKEWLTSHKGALEQLNFMPTLQPQEPKGILPPSELKKEENDDYSINFKDFKINTRESLWQRRWRHTDR